MAIDKNLKETLLEMNKDGVKISIREFLEVGESDITIKTKNYKLVIGATDLGTWLKSFKRKDQ